MAIKSKRVPIKHLDPIARTIDFSEWTFTYTLDEAKEEALRCLQCKNPKCMQKCPAKVPIPQFIQKIVDGKPQEALQLISPQSYFPAICGRVCPQERQCESTCIVGLKGEPVAIGMLERFAADSCAYPYPTVGESTGKKVAIIGAGPAGLSCGIRLREKGHQVTIYDNFTHEGGAVQYGIPFFRLQLGLRNSAFVIAHNCGITFKMSTYVGKDISFSDVIQSHDAVFIGVGADLPRKLTIPGNDLPGVWTAADFLAAINSALLDGKPASAEITPHIPQHLVVIGCGDTALDAARSAVRLGSKVTVVYRRSLHEAPALREDIVAAQQEGVLFRCFVSPERVIGLTTVEGLEVQQLHLIGNPDSGQDHSQQQLVPIDGSVFVIPCDMIVTSIGVLPYTSLFKELGFEVDDSGKLKTTKYKTSHEKVFAGGDTTAGDITVVRAMADGKHAADAIDSMLTPKIK